MVAEFERYGLAHYRLLTGVLQILGATGLLVGLMLSPPAGAIASLGLSVQMSLGVCVRIYIRDSILKCAPAFIFMCLNAILAYNYIFNELIAQE
jgi:hypothetical protein